MASESETMRATALLAAQCPECGGSGGYMVPSGEAGGSWHNCGACRDYERLNIVNRHQAIRAIEDALASSTPSAEAKDAQMLTALAKNRWALIPEHEGGWCVVEYSEPDEYGMQGERLVATAASVPDAIGAAIAQQGTQS